MTPDTTPGRKATMQDWLRVAGKSCEQCLKATPTRVPYISPGGKLEYRNSKQLVDRYCRVGGKSIQKVSSCISPLDFEERI